MIVITKIAKFVRAIKSNIKVHVHVASLALQVYTFMYMIVTDIQYPSESQTDVPKHDRYVHCKNEFLTHIESLLMRLVTNTQCDSPSPFMAFLSAVASASGSNGSAGWMVPWPTSSFTLGPSVWAVAWDGREEEGQSIITATLVFSPSLGAYNQVPDAETCK